MSLSPGARLGPYEVQTLLGVGGMGEVYKGRDIRLGRSVALKVLHADIAREPGLRERFELEARAVSSLNHPRICTLYDVGQHDDREYLVMEFVQGETLAERLTRGRLPLDLAVQYAIEVAEGLDHAHRNGITHRDLKPANVILSRTGAKLLDFGLAKLRQPGLEATRSLDSGLARLEPKGFSLSSIPTAHGSLTRTGAILGTYEYMAPEQLEGHEANERTDIFSFGAVLYEAVTGRRPFEARTPASVIGAVLVTDPPPMQERQPAVPALLEQIVRRCLAKDPEERWQSVRDLLIALRWVRDGIEAEGTRRKGTARQTSLAVIVALLAVIVGGLAVWRVVETAPTSTSTAPPRWDIALPAGYSLDAELYPSLSISPDGMQIVFRAQSSGRARLHIQRLDQFESRPLEGTEGAYSPFFSPDSRWIGFLANSKIYRVGVSGGPATLISNAQSLAAGSPGVTWGPDGTIVFAAGASGLMRVSAESGGEPEPLTTPDTGRGEVAHIGPQFLPGGGELLFTIRTADDAWRVALLSLRTMRWAWLPPIVGDVAGARYVRTGHLVYAQAGNLFAIPLDMSLRAFSGPPLPLSEPVYTRTVSDAIVAQFAISDSGRLVYVSGRPADWTLVSVRPGGEPRPVVATPHLYRYPRFSPDGRNVAVTVEEGRTDIYVVDAVQGRLRKLTDTGSNSYPAWRDNQHLTFATRRRGSISWDVYQQPIDGSADAERLIAREGSQVPTSWNGSDRLAFYEISNKSARDIWMWLARDQRAEEVVVSSANERGATFSSDGRLLAYISDESGRDEIYVRRYPGREHEIVSNDGGTEPVWSPNGHELFYRNNDRLLAVTIRADERIAAGAPRELFTGSYVPAPRETGVPNYDVSPDGQSFVMIRSAGSVDMHLHVIQSLHEELKRLVAPTR